MDKRTEKKREAARLDARARARMESALTAVGKRFGVPETELRALFAEALEFASSAQRVAEAAVKAADASPELAHTARGYLEEILRALETSASRPESPSE